MKIHKVSRKFVLWAVLLCLVFLPLTARAYSLLKATLLHPTTTSLENEGQITSAALLFRILALILLLCLTGLRYFRTLHHSAPEKTVSPSFSQRQANWGWLVGFFLTLSLAAGVIVCVNPRKYYGPHVFQSPLLLTRWFKSNAYSQLPAAPDVVVLGSSRAFRIAPRYIEETLGYSAFNSAVESGSLADNLILVKFMADQHRHTLPKVLLIEVSPPLSYNRINTAARSPVSLIPYMDIATAELAINTRLEGLVSINQLSEAILVAQSYFLNGNQESLITLSEDGLLSQPPTTSSQFQTALNSQIENGNTVACRKISDDGKQAIDQLLKLAEKHDTSVVFYTSPLHPRYYNRHMGNRPGYIRCHTIFVNYMQELMQLHPNVFYLDYSRLDSIDGDTTVKGYDDAHHMTELNSSRLIDAAADTIRQAYAVATLQRAQAQR